MQPLKAQQDTSEYINILFVDDDPVTGQVMKRQCLSFGYNCEIFQSPRQCLEHFSENGADVVVTDLRMPEMNGFELLGEIHQIDPDVPVLVMTGYSSVENAVEAMKLGASDFIKKPFNFDEFRLTVERSINSRQLRLENQLLKKRLRGQGNRFNMIGDSQAMRSLFNTIEKVADVDCNVIIYGESGVGKELVAQALHQNSPKSESPYVVIDCGALTETLLESELFGHEKGAFTGAAQRKQGLMEVASGGTLFLDEISNISDAMQKKLMRAIEEQSITRVGGTSRIPVNVRIVVATNRDLEELVRQGRFRHDFYHRLNVVTIKVPSLDQRREDIPALVEAFVDEFAERYKRKISGFDSASMRRLCNAEWSGNVRELRNTVERCVILADSPRLSWISPAILEQGTTNLGNTQFSEQHFVSLEDLETAYIKHVLSCHDGKKTLTAQVLGIDKTTLWRKLKRAGIEDS